MGSTALRDAIKDVTEWPMKARVQELGPAQALRVFGSLTFNDEVQRSRLPKDVYRKLRRTITQSEPLDASIADTVATAMKDWAIERGATHFTHWFQPMTGITAEKHDSFLVPAGEGRAVA